MFKNYGDKSIVCENKLISNILCPWIVNCEYNLYLQGVVTRDFPDVGPLPESV